MTTSVEGHQVRCAGTPGRQHGYDRHRCMDSLAVDDIPLVALPHYGGDLWCEVVIPPARPGRNARHRDTVNDLLVRKSPGAVSSKYGYREVLTFGKATRDLVYVRLGSAMSWQVLRAHHEDAQRSSRYAAGPLASCRDRHHGSLSAFEQLSSSPGEARCLPREVIAAVVTAASRGAT